MRILLFLTQFIQLSTPLIVSKCCNGEKSNKENSNTPCISYDSDLMAETLDEAMYSFPNYASQDRSTLVSNMEKTIPDEATSYSGMSIMSSKVSIASISGDSLQNSHESCKTRQCLSCKLFLINGFLANPNIDQNDLETFSSQKDALVAKLGTTNGSCYPETRRKRDFMNREQKMSPKNYALPENKITENENQNSTVSKERPAILGVVTNIGCEYRRGDALNPDSQWCGLCNLCWQWRKLPEDYYPNYLNEVNCDHNDGGCLSGFGECKPITRTINLLRKNGDSWQKVTLETTAACECQVEIGTPLHSLVLK